MKKVRIVIISVLLALPVVGASATPAHACNDATDLNGCDRINAVCQKVAKANCVG